MLYVLLVPNSWTPQATYSFLPLGYGAWGSITSATDILFRLIILGKLQSGDAEGIRLFCFYVALFHNPIIQVYSETKGWMKVIFSKWPFWWYSWRINVPQKREDYFFFFFQDFININGLLSFFYCYLSFLIYICSFFTFFPGLFITTNLLHYDHWAFVILNCLFS